jgi:hypothetical protein
METNGWFLLTSIRTSDFIIEILQYVDNFILDRTRVQEWRWNMLSVYIKMQFTSGHPILRPDKQGKNTFITGKRNKKHVTKSENFFLIK